MVCAVCAGVARRCKTALHFVVGCKPAGKIADDRSYLDLHNEVAVLLRSSGSDADSSTSCRTATNVCAVAHVWKSQDQVSLQHIADYCSALARWL
jgi:hypothetical protein